MRSIRDIFKRKLVAPDAPVAFGYKCTWLAIRSAETAAVVSALRLQAARRSGWAEGLETAKDYQRRMVFLTPPVKGWTLVVGAGLPSPTDVEGQPDLCTPFLVGLGQHFPDVQFFGNHRVVGFNAWARVVRGMLVRQYGHSGSAGVTFWNYGENTPEEDVLGYHFLDFSTIDWDALSEEEERTVHDSFPDEDHVMALAGAWSIDPQTLPELGLEPGLGYLGRLPA
jgi:hypothetical protein